MVEVSHIYLLRLLNASQAQSTAQLCRPNIALVRGSLPYGVHLTIDLRATTVAKPDARTMTATTEE